MHFAYQGIPKRSHSVKWEVFNSHSGLRYHHYLLNYLQYEGGNFVLNHPLMAVQILLHFGKRHVLKQSSLRL